MNAYCSTAGGQRAHQVADADRDQRPVVVRPGTPGRRGRWRTPPAAGPPARPPAGAAAARAATTTRRPHRARAGSAAGRAVAPGGVGRSSRSKGSSAAPPRGRAGPRRRPAGASPSSASSSVVVPVVRPVLVGSCPRGGRGRRHRRPPRSRTSDGRTPRSSRSSSWWVPTAVIRPSDSSATRSASSTVDGRCATTSAVVVREHPAQRGLHQRPPCARPARTAGRPAPGSGAGRPPPGPARGAAAGRRRGSGPARRPGCPVPCGSACTKLGLRDVQRPVQLAPRPRPAGAHQDVLPDARREQRRLLEGHGDQRAQLAPGASRRCPRRPG